MKPFNVILCPYDFSNFADKALEYAVKLTLSSGQKLALVNVIVNPFLFEGGSPVLNNNLLALDLLQQIRDEENAKLNTLKERLVHDHPELDVEFILEEDNDIEACILSAQTKTNADLIVMGTHGLRGVERLVMGSDAETVARTSPVPVLLVRSEPDKGHKQ